MEKFSPDHTGSIRKIAILRALQVGDMICAIPAVRALRRHFSDATITLIGLPWQQQFAKRFACYFDHFIEFPGWPGLPEREYSVPDIMKFLHEVQKEKFDLVVQMQGSGYIVNPMCMLFGARFAAGLRLDGDYCPDEALFPVMREDEHEVTRFMKIAWALGAGSKDQSLEFPISNDELTAAKNILEKAGLEKGRYVCVHPGARDHRRRWASGNFARLADALAGRDYAILLTGSDGEKDLLREVAKEMRGSAVDLVEQFGHIGIGELAALILLSGGLVSNDTGVSHIASALHVRSVVIFSPWSDHRRWMPLNENLHIAIKPEEAVNVPFVVNTVLRHIDYVPDAKIAEA